MKIVALANSHGLYKEEIPECDVLVHAGNICNGESPIADFNTFCTWLQSNEGKFKHVLYVPGNWDYLIYKELKRSVETLSLFNATVLLDRSIELNGVVFYGCPWGPITAKGAFTCLGTDHDKFKFPEKLDVLITHHNPYFILDSVRRSCETYYMGGKQHNTTYYYAHEGFYAIKEGVKELKHPPKIHIFGHIGPEEGEKWTIKENGIRFCNVSLTNPKNTLTHHPRVIEYEKEEVSPGFDYLNQSWLDTVPKLLRLNKE